MKPSSQTPLPTIAEDAGDPQPLTPEREAEIREWVDELGKRRDFGAVGPYCALYDSLAEIDRLRAELASQREALASRLRAGQRWKRGRTPALVSQDFVSQDELRAMFGIPLVAPWDEPGEEAAR